MKNALVALTVLCLSVEAQAASFLAPCDVPGVKEKGRCGTYEVWENREAKRGRRIGLKVVVLPATGSPRASDAVTFLAGGPGGSATQFAPFLGRMMAGMRRHRDIVLVDQRGTGGSHALECDLYPGKDPQAALGSFFPLDRVRACRASLQKTTDLQMYTTANSVDDLDEIRGALGYDKLDLFGGSYGTRAALTYMRRHPDHVRVAVLQGVVPPGDPMPLNFPRYAQEAIEQIFTDCQADAECHKALPDLAGDLRSIVRRASAKPVPVEIIDPKSGDPIHVTLSRDLLGEALRYLMYSSSSAVYVPLLVQQAAGGDFAPLAEFALGSRQELVNGIGQGLYLSITCSEDLPFVKAADAERVAANTFLGDYRYREQRAACDAWPRGPIPAGTRRPVKSDAPVLLFSGSWDPVTPPSNAKEVAATLPHALSIVIPGGGHDYGGLSGVEQCVSAIRSAFVERGGTAGLDLSCLAAVHRPPFPTKPVITKPAALTPEQMAAFTGRFAGEGAPPLDITLEHGKLKVRLGGQGEGTFLAPVSPTRIRLLGDIGSYLDVEMQNGKASAITLEQAGTPTLRWKRSDSGTP